MKKIAVTVALIAANMIVHPNNAKAQEGFQAGIEGTPQMSWLINKDDMDNNQFEYLNTLNSSFGISAQYGYSPTMGVGFNVLYSYQGQRYKFEGVEQIRKTEYLKIPLQLIFFKLTEMLSIDASLRGDYGFTDAENKDYKKNINHPNGAVISSRVITNNATAGVTVGLRYVFK